MPGEENMTAASPQSGIVVNSSTNVTWRAGQTKGSAEVEIGFSGTVASDRTIKMGFACHEMANARAAAAVLGYFLLLLMQDAARAGNAAVFQVDIGDDDNAVTFEIRADVRPVVDFLVTVAIAVGANTREDASAAAAAQLAGTTAQEQRERTAAVREALTHLQPIKTYYPEVLHAAVERTRRALG